MQARHSFRRQGASLLLAALLAAPALFGARAVALGQESVSQRPSESQVERIQVASDHHELALLYIKKGNVDRAVAEARKILDLGFPADYEQPVAMSMAILAEKLGELRKFDAAQALLDDAMKTLESASARRIVMSMKARLYKLAGDDDKAIESYRKAAELGRRTR